MDIGALFGPDGALAQVRAGYEPRPQQTTMAEAVAQALEDEGVLVVEAGTGVGKSLGYLLPAALWAARNDRRVLISTHTRALQEQLIKHELPTAAKALETMGLPLRYAMLMGADNYLCVQRLARLRAQPALVSDAGERTVEELEAWARNAQTGHRSELPVVVPQNLWEKLARDPQVCMGPNGPYWERCLFRRDRERADRAHILVVNHALLLSGARLPSYDAMILDEAHNLEEAASSRYGAQAPLWRLVALADEVKTAGRLCGEETLGAAADAAVSGTARFLEEIAGNHGLTGPDDESSGKLLEKTPEAPPAELLSFDRALAEAVAAQEGKPAEIEMRSLHASLQQFGHALNGILKPEGGASARWAAWPRTGPELRSAPLDVGKRLAEGLFSRAVPAILTSATLSDGDGLKGFKSRVGLPEARELIVDSPYDYRAQSAFWCVEGVPLPTEEDGHAEAIAERCAEIVAAVPGGVFILFSSWKLLKRVHGLLRKTIKKRPVWAQGATGHEALLSQFEEAGDAVLLGVDTFWQGVDVPGEALSCVVLVKLPFPNPFSPLEEARRRWMDEEGREYFRDWSLPKAVTKFRQGFGRLIRTSTDRGAVICLDSRMLKKGYGKFFREALPPSKKLESLDDLKKFFGAKTP